MAGLLSPELLQALGLDSQSLPAIQALVGQMGPSDEDKASAQKQALMLAGLGMIGARKGYLAQDMSRAGQAGLLSYNQDLKDLGQQRMQAIGQAAALYPLLQRSGANGMFDMGNQPAPQPQGYGMNDRSMGTAPPPLPPTGRGSSIVEAMRDAGVSDAGA